ncbi:MAG: hypothetical protein N5P05_004478 (plasmid) [Chroococcopsis gigantea SAG 12.99]|jgi:diguanylate cyclase (GGDEF)-like protein|nr:GGDEF domain-containing protein [Chlorogloea purpurea SAG 13.99]MDV3002823.1 hypothetical protein [Chroococcopsis gigantea SAG 12.99]
MTILNDFNDFLATCQSKAEILEGLGEYLSCLFPDTQGGVFQIKFFNNCLESFCGWNINFNYESFLNGKYFRDLYQKYLGRATNYGSGSLSNSLFLSGGNWGEPCIFFPIEEGKFLQFLYIKLSPLSDFALIEPLFDKVSRKILLALDNLDLINSLQAQVDRDHLTNLFNRRYLDRTLLEKINSAGETDSPFSIIMVDIDNFKNINDTYGHHNGDRILKKIALCLQKNSRCYDIICRYGGDEFIIIFPDTPLADAEHRAEQFSRRVRDLKIYHHENDPNSVVTISIGVACFPVHGTTPNGLIAEADRALLSAKKRGKNLIINASLADETE